MYKYIYLIVLLLSSASLINAESSFTDKDLWKHVVTVDRLAWQEREGIKKINKQVNDENFVRRIYLDITGRIPTYEQMISFRKDRDINKRQKLIKKLLDSPGYVSHFTFFWQDLLRVKGNQDPTNIFHREFTRYIERFLYENHSYDKITFNLITATGKVQENPAIGFYLRDIETSIMDTVNATVRGFLGTRIGCAQCHNHRFDKWTQKEFYETTAHLNGVKTFQNISNGMRTINRQQINALKADSRSQGKLSFYSGRLLDPSMGEVTYNNNNSLNYPKDYKYENAKANSKVVERIVFNYGDESTDATNKREAFAKWMTSKSNSMFSKIMPNRLWKRIMGYALMDPIDDWKENITVQNPQLFNALGKIFTEVNYDFKALLSIIFNSEAYQYAIDLKNEFKQDNYEVQGAMIKRMSCDQLNDSLLVLRHGNLDQHARLNDQYFEFEDKLDKLILNYCDELYPLIKEFLREHTEFDNYVEPKIIELMLTYLDKLKELEDYYDIQKNGFIKNQGVATITTNKKNKPANMAMMSSTMTGSGKQDNSKTSLIRLSNYQVNDFMNTFGMQDRSSPETNTETGASMQQILKIMNSPLCKNITKKDSHLMKNMYAKEKLSSRISYLYYNIFGRAPTKSEFNIAHDFFKIKENDKRWQTYVLALLNSPEFYFIK